MTIRARFKLAGQMRIYTAQGRLTQFILGALPFGFILIMLVVKSDYIGVLFQDPAGHVILCIAAMLQVMGFLVIRKIMKIRIQ
jgi:tight adherence protein B